MTTKPDEEFSQKVMDAMRARAELALTDPMVRVCPGPSELNSDEEDDQ